jgi:hypothetical protein
MKTVELEVEKIRAVRRDIAQQFDFEPAKLGKYYRKQEATLKAVAQSKAETVTSTARVKEAPEG